MGIVLCTEHLFLSKASQHQVQAEPSIPTRWQAANARPAVAATVAMGNADARPAAAIKQWESDHRLSLTSQVTRWRVYDVKMRERCHSGKFGSIVVSSHVYLSVTVKYNHFWIPMAHHTYFESHRDVVRFKK